MIEPFDIKDQMTLYKSNPLLSYKPAVSISHSYPCNAAIVSPSLFSGSLCTYVMSCCFLGQDLNFKKESTNCAMIFFSPNIPSYILKP